MSVFSPSMRMCSEIKDTRTRDGWHQHFHITVWIREWKDRVTAGENKMKENILLFCALQCSYCHIRLAFFILTFPLLCMLSREAMAYLCKHTTSQCCEMEWHSVMDDLPHAALAIRLLPSAAGFFKFTLHWTKRSSFSLSAHSGGMLI